MATTEAELIDGDIKRDRKGRKITPAPRRAELVAAYRASGLTMVQFASREGINPLTLAKWSTQLGRGRESAPVRFAEMKVHLPLSAGWAYEVTLPNGIAVRAASSSALAELLGLVRK